MAVARKPRVEAYPELRDALVAMLERFQGSFPTRDRERDIERVKSGERLETDANTLWQAAFAKNLLIADELFQAAREQLCFELTEDDALIPLGVDESAEAPAGRGKQQRDAANVRWSHRR